MTSATAHRAAHSRAKGRSTAAAAMRATRHAGAATARDFESLISDIEDLLTSTVDSVGEQAVAARTRLQKSLAQAKDLLADDVESISAHGLEAASAADDFVRSRPWQVIGLAALAALGAGFLLSRR
jgi:ElaB/YqjD/DUF883 family membrane-anchored ribosome-binding protein